MGKKAYIKANDEWVELISPIPDMTGYATKLYVDTKDLLNIPSQSGHSGEFLTTDGNSTSWNPIDFSGYATELYADAAATSASVSAINAIIGGAPEALNTLNELAAALNDDSNFATTVTNSLSNKLDISSASTTYATKTELNEKPSTGKAIAMAIVFGG